MKKLILVIAIILSFAGFGQLKEFHISSYSIYGSKDNFMDRSFNPNDFPLQVKDASIFRFDDSSMNAGTNNYILPHYGLGGEIELRKENGKTKFILGLNYAHGTNHLATFRKASEHILDTVEFIVPPTVYTNAYGETHYIGGTDTMLLDSVHIKTEHVQSTTSSLMLNGQYLVSFSNHHFSLSTGIGLGLGFSLAHTVDVIYTEKKQIQLIDDIPYFSGQTYWTAQFPQSNPTSGNTNDLLYNQLYGSHIVDRGKLITYFKPYIPIRIETYFAEKGFFSHLGLLTSASAGLELQFIKGAGVGNRFFWTCKAGVIYRI